MPEVQRIPTQAVIAQANRVRVGRRYASARDMVSGITDVPLDTFSGLPVDERRRFICAADVSVNSSISLARRQWRAPDVAQELARAREVITLFDSAEVQNSATSITRDIDGRRVDYQAEWGRYKAQY